ncbi:MAG: N-acetyltransferase [Chlorobiaceae bacterium]|nr:N-acetyltransferase [Chlorobiaceae bacterium]NTV60382.1 N-acetyltransferase [Chlorobiaceae bacterium]
MNITIEPIRASDAEEIIDIFNYYTENTFAAYTEKLISYDMFDAFFRSAAGYPALAAKEETGSIAGFGMLRPFSAIPAFSRTAELTCFLKHGYTGKGIGSIVLEHLEKQGREMGISSILASICSLNEQSIRFHLRNGFRECGCFRGVGRKRGMTFDVIYCQKMI